MIPPGRFLTSLILAGLVWLGRSGGAHACAPVVGHASAQVAAIAEIFVRVDSGEPLEEPNVTHLPEPRWLSHRVAPRETLAQIAARYRAHRSAIRRWNDLEEQGLEPGMKLRIWTERKLPHRRKRQYEVRDGDTWWSIARAHGVDSRDLRAYNWRRRGRLVPGETLDIWIDPIVYRVIRNHRLGRVWPGGVSVGTVNSGRLINAVQLPESPLYNRRRPNSAYGTSHAVSHLVLALQRFRHDSDYRGRVNIRGMSRIRGGDLGSHRSHQTGRDVDIRLLLKESVPQALAPKPARRVDWRAVYELVRALGSTGEVVYVFLDYRLQRRLHRAGRTLGAPEAELDALIQWPRGRLANLGIVRHSPGHDDHLHVRFACGPHEPECVPLVDEADPKHQLSASVE